MWGRGVPVLTVAVLSCRLGITSLSERRPARMAGRDVRAEDSSVLANLWQAGYLGTHFSLLPSIESPVCARSEEHASSSGGVGVGGTLLPASEFRRTVVRVLCCWPCPAGILGQGRRGFPAWLSGLKTWPSHVC